MGAKTGHLTPSMLNRGEVQKGSLCKANMAIADAVSPIDGLADRFVILLFSLLVPAWEPSCVAPCSDGGRFVICHPKQPFCEWRPQRPLKIPDVPIGSGRLVTSSKWKPKVD